MKKNWFVVLIVIISVVILVGAAYVAFTSKQTSLNPTATPTTVSKVTFPKANDTLNNGQQYTITWMNDKSQNPIQLFLVSKLLEDQGQSIANADTKYNIPNTGSYTYTIPENIPEGEYKIEIGDLNSDYFRIVKPNVTTNYCTSDQLSANITSEGAAGSIYGTLTLTNNSATACNVALGNSVNAVFLANNISINYEATDAKEDFLLNPAAEVYSQVHFPNGPQCQSGITEQDVSFQYQTKLIGSLKIQACKSQDEPTVIDIWPLSKTPITQ
ncbi:hypothetical protein BH10PAT1_BH10PAT1_0700 [soil metagenome]